MLRFACSSWFLSMFVLSLTAFIPAATAQSGIECARHLSDCHVDARLEMAGIADPQQARTFLDRLKTAARTGDRNGLAALVKYPLDIRDGDQVKTYRSAAAVVRAFDAVFTRGVLIAIAAAEYESLFVNDSGAMIGDGEIWFDGWSGEVLIKAVSPAEATSTGVSGGGERIFRTQEMLNSLGYDAGAADGRMGPRTRKALAAFQRAQGLPVTSEIDEKTIAALAAAREQGSAPQAAEEASTSPPEETVRGIYSTLDLAPAEERQFMAVITAPQQRGRYFVPRLVTLLDANDSEECIDFSLNINGQDYDSTELARTLKIETTSADDSMIVEATFSVFGEQNHFSYEFIRDGEDWKISDIASLEGSIWRLSDISCGSAKERARVSVAAPFEPTIADGTAPDISAVPTLLPQPPAPIVASSDERLPLADQGGHLEGAEPVIFGIDADMAPDALFKHLAADRDIMWRRHGVDATCKEDHNFIIGSVEAGGGRTLTGEHPFVAAYEDAFDSTGSQASAEFYCANSIYFKGDKLYSLQCAKRESSQAEFAAYLNRARKPDSLVEDNEGSSANWTCAPGASEGTCALSLTYGHVERLLTLTIKRDLDFHYAMSRANEGKVREVCGNP